MYISHGKIYNACSRATCAPPVITGVSLRYLPLSFLFSFFSRTSRPRSAARDGNSRWELIKGRAAGVMIILSNYPETGRDLIMRSYARDNATYSAASPQRNELIIYPTVNNVSREYTRTRRG